MQRKVARIELCAPRSSLLSSTLFASCYRASLLVCLGVVSMVLGDLTGVYESNQSAAIYDGKRHLLSVSKPELLRRRIALSSQNHRLDPEDFDLPLHQFGTASASSSRVHLPSHPAVSLPPTPPPPSPPPQTQQPERREVPVMVHSQRQPPRRTPTSVSTSTTSSGTLVSARANEVVLAYKPQGYTDLDRRFIKEVHNLDKVQETEDDPAPPYTIYPPEKNTAPRRPQLAHIPTNRSPSGRRVRPLPTPTPPRTPRSATLDL